MLGFKVDFRSETDMEIDAEMTSVDIEMLKNGLTYEGEISVWSMTAQEAEELTRFIVGMAERSKTKKS